MENFASVEMGNCSKWEDFVETAFSADHITRTLEHSGLGKCFLPVCHGAVLWMLVVVVNIPSFVRDVLLSPLRVAWLEYSCYFSL